MGARGRWQSFKRGNVPQITINTSVGECHAHFTLYTKCCTGVHALYICDIVFTVSDSTDAPFDELGVDDITLSPSPQNIRRGSISNAYEVMPEELGRSVTLVMISVSVFFGSIP